MGTRTDAGKILVEVAVIGVAYKDHIARTVGDAVVWVCGNILDELVDSVSGGLGGRGLLGANGADTNKKFIANCASVPQKGSNNNLDTFDAGHFKWRVRIRRSRLLGLGTIGDGGILVRG